MKKLYLFLLLNIVCSTVISAQIASKLNWVFNNDTCHYQTKNKKIKLRFGGRIHADAAFYLEDKTDLENAVEINDLRLRLDVDVAKKWNASFNVDFSEGEVKWKDAFVKYNINLNSFVRGGYFLEPFGLEQTESTNSLKFMHHAATVEAFGPGRNLGLEYNRWNEFYYIGFGVFGRNVEYKKEEERRYWYYYGNRPKSKAKYKVDGYDLSTRMVVVPIHSDWSLVHLGTSGSISTIEKSGSEGEVFGYNAKAITYTDKKELISVEVNRAKYEFKHALELLCVVGNVSFQSEYIRTKIKRKDGYKDYTARGWYAQFGWLVNRNKHNYNGQSARLANPKPGTIEILARYNQTDLNDLAIQAKGGCQRDYTLGCNWYINRNMMMKVNFSNVDLDHYSLNGAENFNMVQTRLQYSF